MYGFANGDPVNYSDPFGLCAGPSDIACKGTPRLPGAIISTVLSGIGGSIKKFWDAKGPAIIQAAALIISDGMSAESEPLTPSNIQGKSPEEVERMIPQGWKKSGTRGEGGTRYANPEKPGEQVRVMPGNSNDPDPVKQGPYCRVSCDGTKSDPIPLKGNPTLPPS